MPTPNKKAPSKGLLQNWGNAKKQKQIQLIAFLLIFGAIGAWFVTRSFANPASGHYGVVTPCEISGKGQPKSYVMVDITPHDAVFDPNDHNYFQLATDEAGYFYYSYVHGTDHTKGPVYKTHVYSEQGDGPTIAKGFFGPCSEVNTPNTPAVKTDL